MFGFSNEVELCLHFFLGSVYTFRRVNNSWTVSSKLSRTSATYMERFGISVSLDNNTLVIGADGYTYNTKTGY